MSCEIATPVPSIGQTQALQADSQLRSCLWHPRLFGAKAKIPIHGAAASTLPPFPCLSHLSQNSSHKCAQKNDWNQGCCQTNSHTVINSMQKSSKIHEVVTKSLWTLCLTPGKEQQLSIFLWNLTSKGLKRRGRNGAETGPG